MTAGQPERLPLAQSAIRAMTRRCDQVGGINLGQGLCQVPPPGELLEAAAATIATRGHSYSYAEGDPSFLAAAAGKIGRQTGVAVDPRSQVVATIGATGAFSAATLALFEPGDEVLLPQPCYGYHLNTLRAFGIRPVAVELGPDFGLTALDTLAGAVTTRTRGIVVCTPANPTGRRYTRDELAIVDTVAQQHNLTVVTDEVYEHIYFTDRPHLAPSAVGSLHERTVSITSLSKTFSVPGWRLGYAWGTQELMQRVRAAADTLVVCAPTPLQQIAAGLLGIGEQYYTQLRRDYARRLEAMATPFEANRCVVRRPEGAYYALIDLSQHGVRSGWQAADLLLDRCRIATIPLEAFKLSPTPQPVVRACFSVPDEQLKQLAERLSGL